MVKLIEATILVIVTITVALSLASLVTIGKSYDKIAADTATGHSTAATAAVHGAASHGWCWDGDCGPNAWGTLGGDADCLGTYSQSPIDIPARFAGYPLTTTTVSSQKVKGLTTAGTGNQFVVSQSHGAPKFSCKGSVGTCGHITVNSKQYNLLQMHFHSPSEHTIDGKHYPLCAHLVHQAVDGKYAVLGVMFDQTAATTSTSAPVVLVDKLFDYMKATSASVSTATNAYDLISANSGYYNYQGSFTTPPCTEGVNWFVQSEIIPVTKAQVDKFWSSIGGYPGNSRPTMPINSRSITYNVPKSASPGAWAWTPYDAYGVPVGPDAWTSLGYSDCAGVKQSPIDFPVTVAGKTATGKTANVLISSSPATTDMVTAAAAKFEITQSHGAPKFACKVAGTCGSLTIPGSMSATGDTSFNLLQVHFHSPSEHTIDGKIYPLCAHMVHVNAAGTAYAVIGVVFDSTEGESASTPVTNLLAILFGSDSTHTGYLKDDNVYSSQDLDFQTALLSSTSGFFNYPGSFTTPPCTEVVSWFVHAEVQKVRPSQVKQFYDHIGGFPGNYRPPQPLGARTITYEVA